jgi:hypothetical protein
MGFGELHQESALLSDLILSSRGLSPVCSSVLGVLVLIFVICCVLGIKLNYRRAIGPFEDAHTQDVELKYPQAILWQL